MQFEQLNGGPLQDPERVFAAVRNVSGTTLSAGAAAYHIVASADGISVSNAGTTRKWAFAGIIKDALSDSSYGRAQVYGYCSAYALLSDSAVSAVPGAQLVAVNSATYLKDSSAAGLFTFVAASSATFTWSGGNPWNHVVLMDTIASGGAGSAAALKGVFVKAL